MLVLSRKQGEQIMIGENVVVTVVEIRGDRVRLGFDAPNYVAIHREEVYRRIQCEERQRTREPSPHESPYHPEFA
jgi:carbon storage regulator